MITYLSIAYFLNVSLQWLNIERYAIVNSWPNNENLMNFFGKPLQRHTSENSNLHDYLPNYWLIIRCNVNIVEQYTIINIRPNKEKGCGFIFWNSSYYVRNKYFVKVGIILEQREVAFLSPSKICKFCWVIRTQPLSVLKLFLL